MPNSFAVRGLVWIPAILSLLTLLNGAVPVLEHLFPPSLTPGASNTLNVVGTFDPWPVQLVFNHPGINTTPTTNKASFSIQIDPSVPPGPYLARALHSDGVSEPRLFLVTSAPALAEIEPNDAPDQAQPVAPLPSIIEGRLGKRDDIDQFTVQLQAGQTLIAYVEAFVLASPLDAALRLRNAAGTVVAWNHDDAYTLDPFLHFTAPAEGVYRLELFGFPHPSDSEIRFAGNPRCIYRLHLHNGPWIQSLDPIGVGPGPGSHSIHEGWNLPTQRSPLTFTTNHPPHSARWFPGSFHGYSGPLRIPIGSGPELREDRSGQTLLSPPFAITGSLAEPGETDEHRFNPVPDTTYRIEIQAAPIGSPLDAWISLHDAQGKELAQNDDASMGDPALVWKAPSTNAVIARVGSHLSARSPAHRYRLEVRPLDPGFKAVASAHALILARGTTNEFKISLQRIAGFDHAIQVAALNLPEGVVAEPVLTNTNATEAVLRFITATNSPATNSPLRLVASAPANGSTNRLSQSVLHEIATTGENNGVPQGFHHLLLPETDWLWITVK
jgi:hypothetical protein